ncbi:PDxFFG protein [Mycoplasma sp. 1654_15]|uniref:PDxFFG protein n=1 Tax=Mycoplasma sp. 1654_15 TaxID=2725994 RepID=UPI001449CFE5|nr:PDxFFG protein [Mycoplasma sp. 1654_15]QJB70913.1 PDxFFG protein [Mycoplasma sp. 1654_15]
MKKLTTGAKFIIATSAVVASSAVVVGGIKLYGKYNELGVYHLQLEQSDSNAVEDLSKVSSAEFLDSVGKVVAKYDFNLKNTPENKNSMVILNQRVNGKMTMSVDDFRLWYLQNYNRQTPNFKVKIGLMTFINEYFEALSPQEFVDYAKWFIKNVSWGPETLSLSSFTLKKGVIVNGNAITLGQHQGKRKEETNITFYPDAFFGSLPLASNYAGRGNGPDSLTYQLNSLAFTKEQLQEYIQTLPQRLVISNYRDEFTAGGVVGLDLLQGKKIHRYDLKKALEDTLEAAKKSANQKTRKEVIKQEQKVFDNALNDPDLIALKSPNTDGSVKVTTTTSTTETNNANQDIEININYDNELKKIQSLDSSYFYAFSQEKDPAKKHNELLQKFTTALYIFAKNNNISLADNPQVVFDNAQIDKEYTIEKLINRHRESGWTNYRLFTEDFNRPDALETVDFVLSNPDFDAKKERDSKNKEKITFSYNFRYNRSATGSNKDELNSLMLLEFMKETQPELEKLSTNGFRNFYNFKSTKDKTIFMYENNDAVTFHQSVKFAQDNYSEDFDVKKLKKVSIVDVIKQDKDHLEIKLADLEKYEEYLKKFNEDKTFATKLDNAKKAFSDVQSQQTLNGKNIANLVADAIAFNEETQELEIQDPSLVSFLKKHLAKLKEFYTKHNIEHSENLDLFVSQLETIWNKQLDNFEITGNFIDPTNAHLSSVTETDLETDISLVSSFVDATVSLIKTIEEKPKPKEKSSSEFTISKIINLASDNPKLKQAQEEFRTFKWSVDYFDRVTPRIIKENDEIIDLKPTKTYTLYLDYYDGLIDTILENDPYVATEIDGTHLETSIDSETGEIKYKIADGKYTGFYTTDRISFISLLKASSDKFKTTGINYLKYVGQHEYGHHQTLQYAQNISEKSKAVQGAALSSSGIAVEGLYNKDILQLYLDARSSGLKIRRANASYEESKDGLYSNYTFNKAKDKEAQRWETEKDIFGSLQNESIENLIDNKSRRYLQTFGNLKTAADLRNLKLYDLYLLNAFDFDSGTISPKIEGKSEYFKLGNEILSRIANENDSVSHDPIELKDLDVPKPISNTKLDKNQFTDFVDTFLEKVLSASINKNKEKKSSVSFYDVKNILKKEFNIVSNAKVDENFTKEQAESIYRAKVHRALATFYKENFSSFSLVIPELEKEFKPASEKLAQELKSIQEEIKKSDPKAPISEKELAKITEVANLQVKNVIYTTFLTSAQNLLKLIALLEQNLNVKSLTVEQILQQVKIETLGDLQKYGIQNLETIITKAKNKETGFENLSEEQIKLLEQNVQQLKETYKQLSQTQKEDTKISEGTFPQDIVLLQLKSVVEVLFNALSLEVDDLQAQLLALEKQIKETDQTNKEQLDKLNQTKTELTKKITDFVNSKKTVEEIRNSLFEDYEDGYVLGGDIEKLYNKSLLDGQGNLISFDQQGQIIAGTFEKYPSDTKVGEFKFKNFKPTLFYKNGRPLIDIDTFNDPTSYNELEEAIKALTNSFKSMLEVDYANNGWDSSARISTSNFTMSDGVASANSSQQGSSKYWSFLTQFLNGNLKEFFYSYNDFKDSTEKDLSFELDLSKINSSTMNVSEEVEQIVEARITSLANLSRFRPEYKAEYVKLAKYSEQSKKTKSENNFEIKFDSFTKHYRNKLKTSSPPKFSLPEIPSFDSLKNRKSTTTKSKTPASSSLAAALLADAPASLTTTSTPTKKTTKSTKNTKTTPYYNFPATDKITFRNKDENGKVFDLSTFKTKYKYYTKTQFDKLSEKDKAILKQDSLYSEVKEKDLFADFSDLVSLRNSSFYKLMNIVLYITRQQRTVLEEKILDKIDQTLKQVGQAKLDRKYSIYKNFLPLSKVFDDLIAKKVLDAIKIHDNKTNKDIPLSELTFFINMLKEYFRYISEGSLRRQPLLSLTTASMPVAKVIKIGDNEYYQNPKYDYFAKLGGSDTKIVLDATYTAPVETDPTKIQRTEISQIKSSLWQLLNLNYDFLETSLKKKDSAGKEIKKDLTLKYFGQKGEFAFKSKEENGKTVLDKSKIYLADWDKEEFFEDNFFVKDKENQKETIFTSLSSFIDFISIDVYKFNIAQDVNLDLYRNWNVDYALTKFDLYNYILNQEQKPAFEADFAIKTETKLIEKLKLVLSDKTEEQIKELVQITANNLMDVFENSSFNLLIKNNKFSNVNIDQLFLSEVGYNGFNTLDLNRGASVASNGIDTMYQVDSSISATPRRIGIDYISQIDPTNTLNLDTPSIVETDIENSDPSKSRINKLLRRFIQDKNVDISNARLFELQYLIGTKNLFTYSDLPEPKQRWTRQLGISTRSISTDFNFSSIDRFNSSRFEERVQDYFSDYVYNFAESLTRDLVQTTYLPSTTTLENIPSYLKGFTEKNTGYEFLVDPSYSRKWLQSYTNPVSLTQGKGLGYDFASNPYIANFYLRIFESDLNKQYADLLSIYKKAAKQKQVLIADSIFNRESKQIKEKEDKLKEFEKEKLENYDWIDDDKKPKILDIKKQIQELRDKTDQEIQNIQDVALDQINKYITPTTTLLDTLWKNYYGPFAQDSAYTGVGPKERRGIRLEGYIGQRNFSNNGFFKDRFQRKVLDWQIYDENREPVKDENLEIKDLKGNKVTDRASAVWYYTLESQGIGKQTISAIWRDHLRDQITFWGYNKLEDNDKLEYLAFEDTSTGQRHFLKVQKENTNNIFYFKRQADETSKWTLKDQGYASWATNWSILSTFSNALINPGVKGEKKLRIFFADKNKNEIKGLFHLPEDTTYLAENGKIYTQAPVYIEKTQDDQYMITIKSQFS